MKIKSIWDNGLGFSQFSYCQEGPHLGKWTKFEELTEELQRHIKARIAYTI